MNKRCKCNHNQPCAAHPGLAGWLRRFREYFLVLRMSNGLWVQTPIGGFAWRGDQNPEQIFSISFIPTRWSLIVEERGSYYRHTVRFFKRHEIEET
jgi:hypothetical protein